MRMTKFIVHVCVCVYLRFALGMRPEVDPAAGLLFR